MKRGQLLGCLLVLMVISKSSAAELPKGRVTCSVEVIADICGSGQMSIDFYRGNFKLNNGDVSCWFSDFTVNGRLMNPRRSHTNHDVTVDLVSGPSGREVQVGHLTYRAGHNDQKALATLVTKNLESQGGRSSVYHMRCEEKPGPINCFNSCLAEGKDYAECHDQCGLW